MSSLFDNMSTFSNHEEEKVCFVCENKVTGVYFFLAGVRTSLSKTKIVEKLGDLIGDQFMVIISEDDVICKSCTNLMNTLDRLQMQANTYSNVVLTFLEKKYALDEGELSRPTENVSGSEPFVACRNSLLENHSEEIRRRDQVPEIKSHSSITWMQCDKCQYTTQYNAFMVHHARQHAKNLIAYDVCEKTPSHPEEECKRDVQQSVVVNRDYSMPNTSIKAITSSSSGEMENETNITFANVTNSETIQANNSMETNSDILFQLKEGSNDQVLIQNSDCAYMQVNLIKRRHDLHNFNPDSSLHNNKSAALLNRSKPELQ